MEFIPFEELTADQRILAATKYGTCSHHELYEYNFTVAGACYARRLKAGNGQDGQDGRDGRDGREATDGSGSGERVVQERSTLDPRLSTEMYVRMIPLALIDASPLNPRKSFDQGKHEELTASMREKGFTLSTMSVRVKAQPGAIAQPVEPDRPEGAWELLHPETRQRLRKVEDEEAAMGILEDAWLHRYEIVAGERRWRAARSAGLELAPCVVVEVSDAELVELALIENLQRDELSPVEEAEGYRWLLSQRTEAGAPAHTLDLIAKRLGKSPEHVRQRIQLCRLDGEERKAVETGVLPPRTAYLIGRIPDEGTRRRAAQEILHPVHEVGPLSFRAAQDLISRQFMRALRAVPWDLADGDLVPVAYDEAGARLKGGACADCPFNTMVGDETLREQGKHRRQGECLNVTCFTAKQDAVWAAFEEKETKPELNRRALSREECEEIFCEDGGLQFAVPYVELTDRPHGELLRTGLQEADVQPWRELVAGSGLEVLVGRDRQGKRRELVRLDAAKAAASLLGHAIFKGAERQEKREWRRLTEDEHREETLAKKDEQELGRRQLEEFSAAVRREIRAKVVAMEYAPPAFWKVAALDTLQVCGHSAQLQDGRADDLESWIADAQPVEALALYVELMVFGEGVVPLQNQMQAVAKCFGVDLVGIEKGVQAKVEGGVA